MMPSLRFKESYTVTVVAGAGTAIYTNATGKPVIVRYISERATHVSMQGEATSSDALIPASCAQLFAVDAGKTLSTRRESAETDGPAWATVVERV